MRSPILPVEPSALDEKAHAHLLKFPDVWATFLRFVDQLIAAGRKRYGAKGVIERVRWDYDTTAHHAGLDFVCNNSHTASIVRIYQATYPETASMFRTRKRANERKAA